MKLEVIDCIKNYFLTDKMKFGQAINLSQLKYEILGKAGVIGVQTLELSQFINGRHFISNDFRFILIRITIDFL